VPVTLTLVNGVSERLLRVLVSLTQHSMPQKRKHVCAPADHEPTKLPRRKCSAKMVGRLRDDDDYEETDDEAPALRSRRVRHQSEAFDANNAATPSTSASRRSGRLTKAV